MRRELLSASKYVRLVGNGERGLKKLSCQAEVLWGSLVPLLEDTKAVKSPVFESDTLGFKFLFYHLS